MSSEALVTSIELHENTMDGNVSAESTDDHEEIKTNDDIYGTVNTGIIEEDIEEYDKDNQNETDTIHRKPTDVKVSIDDDDNDEENKYPDDMITTNEQQPKSNPIDDTFKRKYTLLEDDNELNTALPLPYKQGCFHKLKYHIESFLVIHPRIYALYLLYRSTWPRALVIFDMYTDFIVAFGLYKGRERIWFMLSCLFIALPFVLVWSASLRFIQNYLQKLFNNLQAKKSKNVTLIQTLVNVLLIIYMFPPIGSIIIALCEVYWVLSDIFKGVIAFIFGTGLIDAEDRQKKAMKSYRRAIEIFAESIPQTLLQLYIFIRLERRDVAEDETSIGIDPRDLYLSLAVSILNLCINFYNFKKEAKLHGMSWAEYALSVLQLGEIPVSRLVPRLPAIKKGYVETVNFCGFVFDKESLTPLLEAVNSTKCKLKTIKLSIGSLSNLDLQSCKMLGSLLYNAGINVLISRTSSLLDIKNLFESIDDDHNGYLDEEEFLSAVKKLNCSIQNVSARQQQRIFQRLAIRRIKKRDRVYFYDFFQKTASLRHDKRAQIDIDLTMIDHPLHFIFQRIKQIVSSDNDNMDDIINENDMVNNFHKLYQFCDGLNILDEIDRTINNHVFYVVIDALSIINTNKFPKFAQFINDIFFKLLESPIFKETFYLKRNDIFKYPEIEEKLKLNENGKAFVKKLKMAEFSGYNIFEHCLLYKTEYRWNECKLFVNLLNVWLKKVNNNTMNNGNYLENQITKENGGELYYLFHGTNGFHIKDSTGHTPLYWAVKQGLNDVIEFFGKYVFKVMIENNECEWIHDQHYLHSILHHLLKTEAKDPKSETFKSLFTMNDVIDLKYVHDGKYLAHHILQFRHIIGLKKNNNDNNNNLKYIYGADYALKCLEALDSLNYDFVEYCYQSTALHFAQWLNDHEAVVSLIKICRERSNEYLSKLLNKKGKRGRTALYNAFAEDSINIAKSLILCPEQEDIDWNLLVNKINQSKPKKKKQWVLCFGQLIDETNGKILDMIDTNIKQKLYDGVNHFYKLSAIMMIQQQTHPNLNEEAMDKYASTDILKRICLKLQSNLGIENDILSLQNALTDTTLQYAQNDKHFGKICDMDYKHGILVSVGMDSKVILWQKVLKSQQKNKGIGLFHLQRNQSKNDKKYEFEDILIINISENSNVPMMTVGINKYHTLIFCGGMNNTLSIYDINGLKESKLIKGIVWFNGYISYAEFMDDIDDDTEESKYILVGSGDGQCAVFKWKQRDNTPYRYWNIARKGITECHHYIYNHNRILIIFTSIDGCIYFVDFNENKRYLANIFVSKKQVNSCDISPNGQLIATGDDNGIIKIFNISQLKWDNMINSVDENWNGISSICELDIRWNKDDIINKIAKIKWINNSCIVASYYNGDMYYFKIIDDINNKWGFAKLHTNHSGKRISSIIVNHKDNVMCTGGWDFSIGIHDLNPLKND